VAVVAVIARTARTLRSTPWAVALGLLLGGAVGNLTDRIVRSPGVLRGRVVDFLELPHWPVFNVADMGITCAAVLIALLTLRGETPDGERRG
jgi:signal peptidase II